MNFKCFRAVEKKEYLVISKDIFLLILHVNMCCDPSSEPFRRDNSNEGPQHMVLMRNKKKISSNTPSYLELCVYSNTC